MAELAKFTFDTVFERGPDGAPRVARALNADELSAIRAEGYAEGYTAGKNDTTAKAEQDCAVRLNAIADSVGTTVGQLSEERQKLAAEACELAMMVAKRLVPHLMKRAPFAEIEALLTEALENLSDTPHLVVRINEEWLEQVSPRLEQIAQNRGFQGKLIVLGEPDVSMGDCRIEWADGGINRNAAAVAREIEAIIARHMGSTAPDSAKSQPSGNEAEQGDQ